jgi:sugar fermentation stimulation protein A
VHLKRQQRAEFPDAVTQRGVKHLQQLTKAVQQGARAVILYVVQRQDCDAFSIAADIDANYWAAHQRALLYGVEQLCYQCKISLTDMTLERKLTIHSPND